MDVEKEGTGLQDGQVTIRKQYGGYDAEIVFRQEENPAAMDQVKSLIVSAYAARIAGMKTTEKTSN